LRFGYLLSDSSNIEELEKVKCFFNTSLLVQLFALTVLDHQEVFLAHNREVVRMRDELYAELAHLEGVTVHPSATNFLTFTIGPRSGELFTHLVARGIALREVGAHPVLAGHLRVTVSSPADNRLFLNELKQFLSRMGEER
jgi:histidinol-phosphate aminotransferase